MPTPRHAHGHRNLPNALRKAALAIGGWLGLSGVEMTAIGIVLLVLSLVTRHVEALHGEPWVIVCEWCRTIFNIYPVPDVTGWCGSILVIVGVGRILFMEGYWR
jgi:hypothetical protein